MKNYKILLSLAFLVVLATSCTRENDVEAGKRFQEEINASKLFYPLETGKTWTYQIDTVYYSMNLNVMEIDTVSGYYRETIADTFVNSQNHTVHRIIREKQDDDTKQWYVTNVFSLEARERQLIRTEDNYPLIDLVFPSAQNTSWKATALIDGNTSLLVRGKAIQIYKDWPDSYVAGVRNETVLGVDTDVISIIDVEPDDDVILSHYSARQYAKGVGMIYKEQAFYTTQLIELADRPWSEKAEIGFETFQTLISYK